MRAKTTTLYIGIIHQSDEEEDFVDVKFITMSEEQALSELKQIKKYAVTVLKLRCVVDRENYILFKSLNERKSLESFFVERILVVKGERKNERD